jgi:hypothetical protein
MHSAVADGASLAPGHSWKNVAAPSLSSALAKCTPRQLLLPAPNGELTSLPISDNFEGLMSSVEDSHLEMSNLKIC